MPAKQKKRYSARDRLAAYLVILIVIALLLVAAFALYSSGIFTPVSGEVSLQDTKTLEELFPTPSPTPTTTPIPTAPPSGTSGRLLDFFFASAHAEEPEPETPEDIEALFAQLVGEDRGNSVITDEDRITVNKKDLAVNKNLPDNWYNVLLLATDSRDMKIEPGRTDTMIIASINRTTAEIKLTSLARDMYVPIPDKNSSNRLNAAYAFGLANLAMKTVNFNFEMNIQEYILVNFTVMADIIDSLGGLDLELHGSEWAMINALVAVGEDYEGFAKTPSRHALTEQDAESVVHLDGLQAVSYARIRKSDDDLQRSRRQRLLLNALMDKVMENATLSTLLSLFNSVSRTADTNIGISRMMEIGSLMLLVKPSITEFAIPAAGLFKDAEKYDPKGVRMIVLEVNLPQNTRALHEFIYGEYIPAESQ